VALYISDLAGVKSAATLRRRLTTISRAHDIAGLETPTRRAVVREAWKGIARSFGTASTAKTPARIDELRTMVGALDLDRLIGARDRALLVVGFAGALRRSELVALDVSDVSELADGLRVLIRRSKTDQEGAGYALGLPYGSDPLTCPVRSYRAWLEAAGIQAGPIFRPVTKGGALGLRRLSDRAVAEVVKRTAERVGLDPVVLAGHSLRSGLITSAAEAGVHERAIMRHSRHKSIPVMRRYIHEATLFTENAAAMVGL
jgi:integrase